MAKTAELVFILDQSGSMYGQEKDVIGGFNSMIDAQNDQEGDVLVTTVMFSNRSQMVHDRENAKNIRHLTEDDYRPGGSTALYDAIGETVSHIRTIHKYARKEDVPEKTIVAITTDGQENASNRWSADEVRKLIEECRKDGWEFLFLAEDLDAAAEAGNIGIHADRAFSYNAAQYNGGTRGVFEDLGEVLCAMPSMNEESYSFDEMLSKAKIKRTSRKESRPKKDRKSGK